MLGGRGNWLALLRAILILHVFLEDLKRRPSSTEHAVAAAPEHRFGVERRKVLGEVSSEYAGRIGLQGIDELTYRNVRRKAHKHMHVIRFAVALDELAVPARASLCCQLLDHRQHL